MSELPVQRLPIAPPGAGVQPLAPEVRPSIDTAVDLEKIRKFAGRPKGSKNSRPRARPIFKAGYWFSRLNHEWPSLIPQQRANICVDMIKMIFGKLPSLPKNQRDSSRNATEILEALSRLEQGADIVKNDSVESIAFNHNMNLNTSMLNSINPVSLPQSDNIPIINHSDSIQNNINNSKENRL